MSADGKVAAELAAIRRRAEQITAEHAPGECDLNGETCTGHDAERLLSVLSKALALAGTWERAGLGTLAEKAPVHARRRECGAELRSVLAAALTGEDGTS